ncbi:hypothetical protein ABDI30_11990 [Paenibacillus cisolokensis]|uniref:hypothetical protein n=1 Tax=Paenibacillus cisolokensis TaxID=1658519 RepID=UPI003D2E0722
MDPEAIQNVIDKLKQLMAPIIEAIMKLWRALKSWIMENPSFAKLLRKELNKRNRLGAKSLFKLHRPAIKVYQSQVTYRPVRQVARSRC